MKNVLLHDQSITYEAMDSIRDSIASNLDYLVIEITNELSDPPKPLPEYSLVICRPNPHNINDMGSVLTLLDKKIPIIFTGFANIRTHVDSNLRTFAFTNGIEYLEMKIGKRTEEYTAAICRYVKNSRI